MEIEKSNHTYVTIDLTINELKKILNLAKTKFMNLKVGESRYFYKIENFKDNLSIDFSLNFDETKIDLDKE